MQLPWCHRSCRWLRKTCLNPEFDDLPSIICSNAKDSVQLNQLTTSTIWFSSVFLAIAVCTGLGKTATIDCSLVYRFFVSLYVFTLSSSDFFLVPLGPLLRTSPTSWSIGWKDGQFGVKYNIRSQASESSPLGPVRLYWSTPISQKQSCSVDLSEK